MSLLPRVIPRRPFQVFAVVTLALVWLTAGQTAWIGAPPVSTLVRVLGVPLGLFVTWVVVTLGWAVAILPLRLMAKFPTLAETLEARGANTFGDLVEQERERLRNLPHAPPAERRRRHLVMAGVSFVMALALGVAFAVNADVWPQYVLFAPPVAAIVCVALAVYYLVLALLTLRGGARS